jgi:hypothetical protein
MALDALVIGEHVEVMLQAETWFSGQGVKTRGQVLWADESGFALLSEPIRFIAARTPAFLSARKVSDPEPLPEMIVRRVAVQDSSVVARDPSSPLLLKAGYDIDSYLWTGSDAHTLRMVSGSLTVALTSIAVLFITPFALLGVFVAAGLAASAMIQSPKDGLAVVYKLRH